MVLKYYKGAITIIDIRQMSNRELLGYINAANHMESMNEPKESGLSGQKAIDAAQNDPAIRVR